MLRPLLAVGLLSLASVSAAATAGPPGVPWQRHTIDDSSRGADGVRLADVNHDGLSDIVTGWEEGGVTRVYLHPGYARGEGTLTGGHRQSGPIGGGCRVR